MPHFVIQPEAGSAGPARESIALADGDRCVVIASGLAVGPADAGGARVDHGYGLDAWDLGDAWLVRLAIGHRDPQSGEGASAVRFLVSRDGGSSWVELDAAGARDLEHRSTEERRLARIDRWPGGWC